MKMLVTNEPAMFRNNMGSWSSWYIANGPNKAPISRAKTIAFPAFTWLIFAKKQNTAKNDASTAKQKKALVNIAIAETLVMVLGDIEVKRPSRVIKESNENIADNAKATAKANRDFCNTPALYPNQQFCFQWIKGFLNFASAYAHVRLCLLLRRRSRWWWIKF